MTRRRLAAAVGLGAALYSGALYLIVTAELGEPRALIAMVTIAGLIFTVTGVVAALRRPDNRTGAQMLAVGLLWSLGALQLANGSLLFTLGYVLGGVAFVAFAHLILSYPTARLRPGDEWIVWAVLALVTVGPFVVTLLIPRLSRAATTAPRARSSSPTAPGSRRRSTSPSRSARPRCRRSSSCGSSSATGRRRRRSGAISGPSTSSP